MEPTNDEDGDDDKGALLFQNKRPEAKRTLQTLTGRHTSGPIYNEAMRLLAGL